MQPPNDNSCPSAFDGICDDSSHSNYVHPPSPTPYSLSPPPSSLPRKYCECGTDSRDCGQRSTCPASPSEQPNDQTAGAEKPKLASFILCGVLGLFGLTLLVLLIVSRFTEKAKPQPNRTGTPNADRPEGWGPFGFLFPKSWVYVWWGYLAMVVASSFALPAIFPQFMPDIWAEPAEIILLVGPCVHCLLMPFLWVHKHREDKKWIENHLNDDVVVATALDPEAKTTIFSRKLTCGMKCKVFLLKFTLGLVNFVLRIIKYSTGGVIDLSAFWFPAPFYNFWEAKMQIDLIQINGAKICTNATQADAYMKFCTEAVLNFWTLGFYGKCCKGRTSYGRWLDRHVLWQGKPPEGYNNRESAPVSNSPTPLTTEHLSVPRQSFASSTRSCPAAKRSRSILRCCCSPP